MEVTFTHDKLLAEGEECEFTGSVTVKMPMYQERSQFARRVGLLDYKPTNKSAEQMDDQEKIRDGLAQIDIMAKAADLAQPYIVSCDLVNTEGMKLATMEDFFSHPGATPILTGLLTQFIGGFVSKKTKPSSGPKS